MHRVQREGAVEVGHEQVWIRFLDDGAELLRDGRHMRRKSHASTYVYSSEYPLRRLGDSPLDDPRSSEASLPLFCTGIFVNYAGSLDSEQLCCSVRGGDNLGGAQQHTLEQPCGNPVPLAPARCGRGARRRPAEVRVCTERACAVVSCQ